MHVKLSCILVLCAGLASAQVSPNKSVPVKPRAAPSQIQECRAWIVAVVHSFIDDPEKGERASQSEIVDLKKTINDCVAAHWRELSKNDLAMAASDINLLNEALIIRAVQGDAQAGEQSIDLGSVTLKLGMPKDTVISRLAAQFDVRPIPVEDSGAWAVLEKNSASGGDWGVPVGTVTFDKGRRLVAVVKQWGGHGRATAAGMARALYGAVADLERAHVNYRCRVGPVQSVQPDSEYKAIRLICGQREIIVDMTREADGQEAVSISESLGQQEKN